VFAPTNVVGQLGWGLFGFCCGGPGSGDGGGMKITRNAIQ